jgi:hypothetical protein
MPNDWSKPYHGVTHKDTPRAQLTVTAYQRFAVATLFLKPISFTSNKERTFLKSEYPDSVAAAKSWLEGLIEEQEALRRK